MPELDRFVTHLLGLCLRLLFGFLRRENETIAYLLFCVPEFTHLWEPALCHSWSTHLWELELAALRQDYTLVGIRNTFAIYVQQSRPMYCLYLYLYYLYLRQSYGHNQQPFHYFCEANQANVLSLFVFVLSIFETKVHVSHNPQLQHFHYFCEQADVLSGRQKKVVWLPLQTFTPFIFLSLWRLMMGNRVLLELDSKYMRLNDWRPSHFEKSPCKENYAVL